MIESNMKKKRKKDWIRIPNSLRRAVKSLWKMLPATLQWFRICCENGNFTHLFFAGTKQI